MIPVPEIASRAEETLTRLRAIDASLQPTEEVREIDTQLGVRTERIEARLRDHIAALDGGPALRALAHMTSTWQAERNTLAGWNQTLTWYANELERQIQELNERNASWNATLELARESNAPPPVMSRIQEIIRSIGDTRRNVERYRAQILGLQDRDAREIATCDEAIDRIASYRKKEVGQILIRDTPPMLTGLVTRVRQGGMGVAIRNALRDELAALPEFFTRAGPLLLMQLLLLILLGLTFRQARNRARSWVENDPALDRASRIFGYPYSSALIVTTSTANWLYPWAPHLIIQGVGLIGLVPVARLVRGLIHPRLVPLVYTLSAFFVLDRVRDVVAPVPALEQAILMLEMAVGVGVLGWMLWFRTFDGKDDDDLHRRTAAYLRAGARVVIVLFAVSLVSGLLGYMRLAHLIGGGALIAVYIAMAIFAVVRALDGLVAYALRARPLRLLRMVRRHRPTIQQRVWRALLWLGVLGWAAGALYQFQILEPIVDRISGIITTQLTMGAIHVRIGDVLAFFLTVWLSFQISRLVRFVLEEDVFPQVNLGRGVPYAITSVLHYVVLIGGTLLGFAAMGIDLTRFSLLAGALGVGVGFGLQNIVNNFVSGLILLFERPVQVGDSVQIASVSGEVKRIGIRSSTVRTGDGADVVVPNASLISEAVTNWTLTDRLRKIEVRVRVAYGSDPDQVLKILLDTATANERILPTPEPSAQFTGFGESSLDFLLEGWIARLEQAGAIRSELALGVYRALRDAGIQIPMPQREVRVHVSPDGGERSDQG